MLDRRWHGTLLHFGLRRSRSNICYYHRDLHPRSASPGLTPAASMHAAAPSYSTRHRFAQQQRPASATEAAATDRASPSRLAGPASVARSSAIHFRGRSIRQVSCYTLLSGFRLPWPPSCCLYRPTPFRGSNGRSVGHLSRTFGSSHITSSAYQKWPTWHRAFVAATRRPPPIGREAARFARSEFESRSRPSTSPGPPVVRFTGRNCVSFAC